MSLKTKIEAEIKQAMLNKDKERLTPLRAIKALILLAESEKGGGDGLSEDTELKLLTKAAKQRKDSLEIYKEQGREDLASKEESELKVIEEFLPKQLTDAELEAELKAIVSEVGASGPQDMGKVMGAATKKLAGKADGKAISAKVKELLTQ
ncbi:MAG: GatB/YqeY domain-containing protein [Cyclobacteriaceae bacterium]